MRNGGWIRGVLLSVLVLGGLALFTGPAMAQGGECIFVCHVYYNNHSSGRSACHGTGGVCFSCYKICDGQPYPMDYGADPGHLVSPEFKFALADGGNLRDDGQEQLAMDTRIAMPAYCESRSLFGRLAAHAGSVHRAQKGLLGERPKPSPLQPTQRPKAAATASAAVR